MALEPTENSRLIGHYPAINELREVIQSNGVDTSMSHATISDDYSRLLYPCKEKTEGKWPNCPFTLLVVQLDEGEEAAKDGGGGFTVYANGDHCHHNAATGEKLEIRLDSLASGIAGVKQITRDGSNGRQTSSSTTAARQKGKWRIVFPPRRLIRRKVAPAYTHHSSVDTYADVNRVRVLDEQIRNNNGHFSWQNRFACRRSSKQASHVKTAHFTDCPRRMLAVQEEDGSFTIYTKAEHNHPIDERPRRVFHIRQLAAQYLSANGGENVEIGPPQAPPLLQTETWRLRHRLGDKHKFLGTMDEVECWASLRLRGVTAIKPTRTIEQIKCSYPCPQLKASGCRYKLYTIPVDSSTEGKQFHVYEKGSHNEHTERDATIEDAPGLYLKSFSSWHETDKFRLDKKLKQMNRLSKDECVFYNCYTNGCNYSVKAIEGTAPDGSTEIRLYELNEHQHKRRVELDEPLPEGVKKARLDGCTALEVDSAEWRTAYRIDQQFRYVAAMSQSEWKAHQKAHRITRNGILSFGGMKGGYYCAVNPYSGCQYRMAAVRDELDDDKVHVLEKGEHSDHATINAPKGQKAKKEIPIGAGYTHFRTLATLDEVSALAGEMNTAPLTASYEGRKLPYACKRKCQYLVAFIQHTENGPWEAYEKGKHLHPV